MKLSFIILELEVNLEAIENWSNSLSFTISFLILFTLLYLIILTFNKISPGFPPK